MKKIEIDKEKFRAFLEHLLLYSSDAMGSDMCTEAEEAGYLSNNIVTQAEVDHKVEMGERICLKVGDNRWSINEELFKPEKPKSKKCVGCQSELTSNTGTGTLWSYVDKEGNAEHYCQKCGIRYEREE